MININNTYLYNNQNFNEIKICTDASMTTSPRTIICAGAVSMVSEDIVTEFYADKTNDAGELLGIFLGIKLGHQIAMRTPYIPSRIIIYSDSEYAIGCFTWMNKWLKYRDDRGILYKSSNSRKYTDRVSNQNIISMIIRYCYENMLNVVLMDVKAHLKMSNYRNIYKAMNYFYARNNVTISYDEMYRIIVFNNYIDEYTRCKLGMINLANIPRKFVPDRNSVPMCYYTIPTNYNDYINRF